MAAACCCVEDESYDCDSDVSCSHSELHHHSSPVEIPHSDHLLSLNLPLDSLSIPDQQVPSLIDSSSHIHAKYNSLLIDLQSQIDSLSNECLKSNNSLNDLQLRVNNSNIKIQELQSQSNALLTKNSIYEHQISDLNSNLLEMENSYLSQLELVNNLSSREQQLIDYSKNLDNQIKALENINQNDKSNAELEIQNLKSQIDTLNEKNANLDLKSQSEIDRLSNYLYVQYAQKHESKVQELKSLYKSKLEARENHHNQNISSLKSQLASSNKEILSLKQKLASESAEKQKLIKLWDDYSSMDKENVIDLQSFLKSIK